MPLRDASKAGAGDLGDGFGMPADSDSEYRLERAIASVMRRKRGDAVVAVRAAAGLSEGEANSWCIGQVYIRTRSGGSTDLSTIAHRLQVPTAVLRPSFQSAREAGLIVGDDDHLELTDRGRDHVRRFVASLTEWLADELADWGDPNDEQLRAALGRLAQRFVDADPDSEQARERAEALFGG